MKTGKSQSPISSVVSNYITKTILACRDPNNGQDALEDRRRAGNRRGANVKRGKTRQREACRRYASNKFCSTSAFTDSSYSHKYNKACAPTSSCEFSIKSEMPQGAFI